MGRGRSGPEPSTEDTTAAAAVVAQSADEASTGGSFEAATERLAAIVEQLESGELPLERSLELFEEGTRLAREAQRRLDAAERRVEELLRVGADGQPVTSDFEGS